MQITKIYLKKLYQNFDTKENVLKKLDFKICEAKDIGIPEKCITDIVKKHYK